MRKKINFIRPLISRAKLQRKLWNNRSYETYAKTNLNVKSVNLVRLPKAASLFFKVWLLNMASAMFSYRDFRGKGPLFESYLSYRYRKTIFWQSSSSRKGSQVVPQNSILWTSPSTIYTNDLPNVIENGTVTLFADDTALHCPSAFGWHTVLTEDQVRLSQWLYEQKQTLNVSKSKCRWSDYHTNTLTHCNTFARLCGCHMGRLKLFDSSEEIPDDTKLSFQNRTQCAKRFIC